MENPYSGNFDLHSKGQKNDFLFARLFWLVDSQETAASLLERSSVLFAATRLSRFLIALIWGLVYETTASAFEHIDSVLMLETYA
jgi:hypothetical protein